MSSTPSSGAPRAAASSRRGSRSSTPTPTPVEIPARSDVAIDVPIFTPPFVGARVAKGISLDEIAAYVNETALFRNQWQFRPRGRRVRRGVQGRGSGPQLRAALDEAKAEGWLVPAVAWGYFPVNSDGDDLIVWKDDDRREERLRFHFPRQQKDRFLCISDFFRPVDSSGRRLRRVPRDDRRQPARPSASGSCSRPTSTPSTSSPTASRSR